MKNSYLIHKNVLFGMKEKMNNKFTHLTNDELIKKVVSQLLENNI